MRRHEVSELYECRGCGGIVARTSVGGCPYCGKTEGPTVERATFEGDTREVEQSWYRVLEINPEAIA